MKEQNGESLFRARDSDFLLGPMREQERNYRFWKYREALIKSDAHEGMDFFSSPRTPRFNQRFPKSNGAWIMEKNKWFNILFLEMILE